MIVMAWGSEFETYTMIYTGRGTMKGWWFEDPANDGEEMFLPASVIVILERKGDEAGDIWIIDIPNWLAKAKELI